MTSAFCKDCNKEVDVCIGEDSDGDVSVPGGTQTWFTAECLECHGDNLFTDETMSKEIDPSEYADDGYDD